MRKLFALAVSLFGLFVSVYLWWVYAAPNHPIVCLGTTGCDEVRASRYAEWFGIPTPALGALMYATLVILLFAEPLISALLAKRASQAIFAIAAAGTAFSVFLSYLEEFVIHAWCTWCIASALSATAIFLLSWPRKSKTDLDPAARLRVVGRYAVVVVVAVVAGVPAFLYLSNAKNQEYIPPSVSTATSIPYERLVRPDSHITGSSNPVLTVVEFGDFQCPACVMAQPTNEEILHRYGDRVRFVFRHYPLPAIHVYAQKASEAAECAATQGKFWDANHRFYAAEGDLGVPQLKQYAAELGLDMNRFNACLDSGSTAPRIAEDVEDGRALGVTATPTFFINGQKFVGPLIMTEFAKLLVNPPPAPPTANAAVVPAPSVQPGTGTAPPVKATNSPAPLRPEQHAAAVKPERPAATPVTSSGNAGLQLPGMPGGGSNPLQPGSGSDSAGCDVNATTTADPNEIGTSQAKSLLDSGAQFVDIRSKREFDVKHISGAVSLPLTQVALHSGNLPKNRTIVVYESGLSAGDVCAASRAVSKMLRGYGFKDVKVYRDGLAAWEKQNLPIAKGN